MSIFRPSPAHKPRLGARDILRYIGPGFLVTVGFIDPGNWAANIAAGSEYGYSLLWMVTLSTIMLIMLQHNAAHLGIATGLCLAEAATRFLPKWTNTLFLGSSVLAAVATALAELLGAAIGLNMLFGMPLIVGAALTAVFVSAMIFTNSYRKVERWIIGFVSLIGLAFLFELSLVKIDWGIAVVSWGVPAIPQGALPIVMSVMGAVVMPHNIFLHSEVIQSRQWNLESDDVIEKQLRCEFIDTLLAMLVGWAINSAMILVAASVFFANNMHVNDLPVAQATLKPLLGDAASVVFASALILAGISSSLTASMAGGSIYAGCFGEPFDHTDSHSRTGIIITLGGALAAVFFIKDTFQGLIWSQIALSMQLPVTVFGLIFLTSSERVMGRFANSLKDKAILWVIALVVTGLNATLLIQLLF
ncbi:MAG TPA: Nramp family divalent metal transporter [Dissulfurispiraceae bacterium]|nr:Nramp family divalent metal transporter [Dissulfurispiraceae bacterium]